MTHLNAFTTKKVFELKFNDRRMIQSRFLFIKYLYDIFVENLRENIVSFLLSKGWGGERKRERTINFCTDGKFVIHQ